MRSPDRPLQILRLGSTKFTNKARAKGLIWESMHTCLSHPIQSIKDTLPAIILPKLPYAGVTGSTTPLKAPRNAKQPDPKERSGGCQGAIFAISGCEQLPTRRQHTTLPSASLARLEVEGFDADDGEGGESDRKGQEDADNLHDMTVSQRC